eukprot:1270862-Prymnesium_polylepis.1
MPSTAPHATHAATPASPSHFSFAPHPPHRCYSWIPDTILHQPTALPTLATQCGAPDAIPRTNPTPAYRLK